MARKKVVTTWSGDTSKLTSKKLREIIEDAAKKEEANGWKIEDKELGLLNMITFKKGGVKYDKLHLLACFLTCGLWLIVWWLLTQINPKKRMTLRIDDTGRIEREEYRFNNGM